MRPLLLAFALLLAPMSLAAGPTGRPVDLPEALEDAAKAQVRATLRAPQTANFRRMHGFRLSDGGFVVCGQVNSRNLTGLAMGWKPIFVRFRAEGGSLVVARRIVDWPADVACRHLAMGWELRTGN